MLKRNGEICEAAVPDYPGRLTATEKRAYSAGIAAIEDQLRDLEEAGRALTEVERQIPDWQANAQRNGNGATCGCCACRGCQTRGWSNCAGPMSSLMIRIHCRCRHCCVT